MLNSVLNILSMMHSWGSLQLQKFAHLQSSGEKSRLETESESTCGWWQKPWEWMRSPREDALKCTYTCTCSKCTHKRKTVFRMEGNSQINARYVTGERNVLVAKREESFKKCQGQLPLSWGCGQEPRHAGSGPNHLHMSLLGRRVLGSYVSHTLSRHPRSQPLGVWGCKTQPGALGTWCSPCGALSGRPRNR